MVGASTLLVYISALAMHDVDCGHPDSITTNLWDALWWATVSIRTAGYGDLHPPTLTGRLIAVALMIYGIALPGVVTATPAAWLIRQVTEEEAESAAATVAHVEHLSLEIADLRGVPEGRLDRDR